MSEASVEQYHPGLEGVIAGQTAISNIEEREGSGILEYRGYRIEDLAGHVSYEETAFLLLHGDLPDANQLRELDARLRGWREIPKPLVDLLETIPAHVSPMDVLRTAVSVLSHFDPELGLPATDHAANVRKAERMIAQMATAIALRERLSAGLPPIAADAELDHAANFLFMVTGKVPSARMHQAFDASLVLYAEHELNASTFSARVTVSTLSDIASGIVAAIGALKGPLHGGASEQAWSVLESVGSPESAGRWVELALARQQRIMGFGHRVYKQADPRAAILEPYCRELSRGSGGAGKTSPRRSSRPWWPARSCLPTWTGRVHGSITTWDCRYGSTRPSSPWRGWLAGRLIASSSSTTIGSCGLEAAISGQPGAAFAQQADEFPPGGFAVLPGRLRGPLNQGKIETSR